MKILLQCRMGQLLLLYNKSMLVLCLISVKVLPLDHPSLNGKKIGSITLNKRSEML